MPNVSAFERHAIWVVPMLVLGIVAGSIGWLNHIDFLLQNVEARLLVVEQAATQRGERVTRVEERLAATEKRLSEGERRMTEAERRITEAGEKKR